MSKRLETKYKINRRLGLNLWGRPKSPVNVRTYGPGQHGQMGRKKKNQLSHRGKAFKKLKKFLDSQRG